MASGEEFYVRYYVGHKGKFGHEFLEFEFRPDGMLTSLFVVWRSHTLSKAGEGWLRQTSLLLDRLVCVLWSCVVAY